MSLRGESPDGIPLAALDLNTNQVDWRQLRRWRIDEARVPAGTLVRFREPSVWDRYARYIVGATALVLTQTALITGLLIHRKRRRRAEEDLRQSQGELRRSYERNRDLGARLLKAQESERARIASELHDDICQRMLLLTIELESLNRANAGQQPGAGRVDDRPGHLQEPARALAPPASGQVADDRARRRDQPPLHRDLARGNRRSTTRTTTCRRRCRRS